MMRSAINNPVYSTHTRRPNNLKEHVGPFLLPFQPYHSPPPRRPSHSPSTIPCSQSLNLQRRVASTTWKHDALPHWIGDRMEYSARRLRGCCSTGPFQFDRAKRKSVEVVVLEGPPLQLDSKSQRRTDGNVWSSARRSELQ